MTMKISFHRKKATFWTEEEHRLFLRGLKIYGKGDWKNISRNVIVTKTPTQVATYAKEFFIRQSNKRYKKKIRASIHDITTATANLNLESLDDQNHKAYETLNMLHSPEAITTPVRASPEAEPQLQNINMPPELMTIDPVHINPRSSKISQASRLPCSKENQVQSPDLDDEDIWKSLGLEDIIQVNDFMTPNILLPSLEDITATSVTTLSPEEESSRLIYNGAIY